MSTIHINATIETDALTTGPLLEILLKTAIEKVFFTDTKVISLNVERVEDDIPAEGIQTKGDVQ